jgi:hypothetical protein
MVKHDECDAARSSSGLVTPLASSAARAGNDTSYVPTPDDDNST